MRSWNGTTWERRLMVDSYTICALLMTSCGKKKVSVIERAIERVMLGVSRFTQVRDGIRSSLLRHRSKIREAAVFAKDSKIRWGGHVMRFNDNFWTGAVSDLVPRNIKRHYRKTVDSSTFSTKSLKKKFDALRVPREPPLGYSGSRSGQMEELLAPAPTSSKINGSQECGPNEEFRRCASCEPTCGPIPCLPVCFPPACQCIGGYVRDNGKCIERNKCKKQSETNGKPTSTITNSFPCAKVKCPPGQYCEFYEGATMCVPLPGPCASVRCAGTECIEYNDTFGCFNTTCGPNEEFKRCASCEPTCGPIVPCLDVCQPPTCQCKGGYVRSKGMCIKQSSCEKSGEHGNNPYHR
ncbi:hypothetical protein RB195_015538 [Necator americanus]|uniref:TIL domain-containing protein n=1 Tax=Necator americanus TaxID=51031 RepID=A0ABR1E510_NECAM